MSWYENAVIYQIYPRSFRDSNGDGVGDLNGITEKLPYIKSLGVDAIWLSPIYKSPMKDFGYDIEDYRAIDPIFGNMEDLDHLVSNAHKLGLKVLLDMVLNHSSDKHKWFQQSRLKDRKYSNFYIWRDKIPNNWMACFGGRAWTFDSTRGQYYLHSFLKEQPDLNWHDNHCREAIFNEIRFYLDKGIDGFRLDVINMIGKDPELKSNPFMFGETPRPYDMQNHIYDRNTPYTHEYIRQLRKVMDEYDERVLLGEIAVQGSGQMEQSASYMGSANDELQLCFEFSLVKQPLKARNLKKVAKRWYELCSLNQKRIPCWVLSNHDVPRAITRAHNNPDKARLLAMYLLLQRGASVMYFGEEIGMMNRDFPKKEIQDPLGLKYWPIYKGRDGERRPMQWDSSENMGFSLVQPWLEPNYSDNWRRITVQAEESDHDSLLMLYRRLISLRKSRAEIGTSDAVFAGKVPCGVLAYSFTSGGKCTLVILNFSRGFRNVRLESLIPMVESMRIELKSHERVNFRFENGVIAMPGCSGVVLTN